MCVGINIIDFLDEFLLIQQKNILQEDVFIILSSRDMIEWYHLLSIIYSSIVMMMQWHAANLIHFEIMTGQFNL